MAHTALGNVSAITYNSTQDKTINLATPLAAGTLLVAISMGYGTDGTIDVTNVTDSKSNTWGLVKARAGSPSRLVVIAWTRIATAMTTGDSVLINLQGSHARSFAVLRGYEGLGLPVLGSGGTTGSSFPASVGAIAVSGLGRAIGACFYTSQYTETDFWVNGFGQTVVTMDIPNVDTYTVGERTFNGTGTVTPANNIGQFTDWAIAGVAFPESPMPGAIRRRRGIVVAG